MAWGNLSSFQGLCFLVCKVIGFGTSAKSPMSGLSSSSNQFFLKFLSIALISMFLWSPCFFGLLVLLWPSHLSLAFVGSSTYLAVCCGALGLWNSFLYLRHPALNIFFKNLHGFFSLLYSKIFVGSFVHCWILNIQCLTWRKILSVYWMQQNSLWFCYFRCPLISFLLTNW